MRMSTAKASELQAESETWLTFYNRHVCGFLNEEEVVEPFDGGGCGWDSSLTGGSLHSLF